MVILQSSVASRYCNLLMDIKNIAIQLKSVTTEICDNRILITQWKEF